MSVVQPPEKDLQLHCLAPGQIAPAILDGIEALVLGGQAVGGQWVRHNLEKAFCISWAQEPGGRVVATVSLKHPRPEYVAELKEHTGLDLSAYLERGYTSVHPDWRGRGLGTRMVRYVTSQSQGRPIYVVIATDNLGAIEVTRRCGTRLTACYTSAKTGREYGVWLQDGPAQGGPGQG